MPSIVLDPSLAVLPCARVAAALHRVAHLSPYSDDARAISALAMLCASAPRLPLEDVAVAFAALADTQPPEPEPEPEPEPNRDPAFDALTDRLAAQDNELRALRETLSLEQPPSHTIGGHDSSELRTLTDRLAAQDTELSELRARLIASDPGPVG